MRAEYSEGDELRRDELAQRLRWLINLRWIAFFGVVIAIILARQLDLLTTVFPIGIVDLSMGCFNGALHWVHRHGKERPLKLLEWEALLQISVDVMSLALLLFFAGGLSNPFVFYFSFHVVIAAILLGKRQAYAVAMLASLGVLLLGMADEFNWAPPLQMQGGLLSSTTTLARFELIFALSTTLIISVYMVTAIMESLRQRTQDVRRLNFDLADRVEKLAATEKRLEAAHQRVRAILECMDEGVVVVDLFGKVILANSAAQKSAFAALTESLRVGSHESERSQRASGLNKAVVTPHGFKEGDYCQGPLVGENLIQHHRDHPVAAACHLEDAPAHASATEQEAHRHCPMGRPAACLQESLANGGHLCPSTLALLGARRPDHAIPATLIPPEIPTLAQLEVQGRRFENTVSTVRTATGESLGMVIVARDVTERRLLERQVVHAEKLNALGSLAAGVAHELNTPLGTILGYAQMLLDDVPTSSREIKVIEEQARRCKKIVLSLLDLAHKSSGDRKEASANDLMKKVHELLDHAMRLRGIEIHLDLEEPPPPPFHVAVSEIEQVLVNLVTNAADAIEACLHRESENFGNPVITLRSRLLAGNEVLICVEDNGSGVANDIEDQIFEPFFTTKEAGKGTGLGLSIARRIVEDHGGTLVRTARLDQQRGSQFEIRLRGERR